MGCKEHNWLFSTPCPECVKAEQAKRDAEWEAAAPAPSPEEVTAAETVVVQDYEPAPPHKCVSASGGTRCDLCFGYIEPELPNAESIDRLDLPPLLRRRPDGGFVYPSLHATVVPPQGPDPALLADKDLLKGNRTGLPGNVQDLSDRELLDALSDENLTVAERQPLYREHQRRDEAAKTKARLAALKESKRRD